MTQVSFSVDVASALSAERMWRALTDWAGHARWIPATTVTMLQDGAGVGTEFIARTGIGAIALDDTMVVREFDVERRLAIVEKTGPMIVGTAGFIVVPRPGGCMVRWVEDVTVPRVPRCLGAALSCIGALSFRIALYRLEALERA